MTSVAILGSGAVGVACAGPVLQLGLASQLTLYDLDGDRARDEALDFQHAAPLLPECAVEGASMDSISPADYQAKICELQEEIESLPSGEAHAELYQTFVGELVKYCFFHTLANPQRECQDVDGRVRRDWIFSNRAGTDFWRTVQDLHTATQIVWECKNYNDLQAGDFHQLAYYMNQNIGTFIVVSFRGEDWKKPHYFQHIRRVATQIHPGCMVILLTDADLKAFLRQAARGSVGDGLLRDRYDTVKQKIS